MTSVAVVHRDKVPGSPANYNESDMLFVKSMIKEALDFLGGIGKFISDGDRVVIKPNVTGPVVPEQLTTTDPRVVEALINLIKEETGAGEIIVVDCSAFAIDTELAFLGSGIASAVQRAGGKLLALEKDEYREVEVPGAKVLRRVRLPRTVLDADVLINVPKMKTHIYTMVSLSLKNQHGYLLWGDKERFHRTDLDQKFSDLYRAVKPNLAIVDGICAMQGQGPHSANPEDLINDMNVIIAGTDCVAVDAVASAVMGFDPLEVPTTRIASSEGLGEADLRKIDVKGKEIKEVRRVFRRPNPDPRGVSPYLSVYVGAACIGCLGAIRGLVDAFTSSSYVDLLRDICVIVGKNSELPNDIKGEVYVVGDCAEEHKARGKFFPGCPPMLNLIKAFQDWDALGVPRQKQR
jgi:uncharacterized protein (DUF362 family)